MTLLQIWDFIQTSGVLGGAFLIGWFLYTKRLRFGWSYDELSAELKERCEKAEAKNDKLEREREALLMTALSNAGIANVLLQSAEAQKAKG